MSQLENQTKKAKLQKIVKDGYEIINNVTWGSTMYDETMAIITRAQFKLLKIEANEEE